MGFKVCIFLLLGCLLLASKTTMARDMKRASIVIQGASRIAETDENFVCATLDWWPHDKCNYDNCPWGYSSVINMVITKKRKKLEKRISLCDWHFWSFELTFFFYRTYLVLFFLKLFKVCTLLIKLIVPSSLVFLISETCSFFFFFISL